jgi:hypothetical protein
MQSFAESSEDNIIKSAHSRNVEYLGESIFKKYIYLLNQSAIHMHSKI